MGRDPAERSLNSYAFLDNDVVNAFDYLGLWKRDWDEFKNDPRAKGLFESGDHNAIAAAYKYWLEQKYKTPDITDIFRPVKSTARIGKWLKRKRENRQVPFAMGLNTERLFMFKPTPFKNGTILGLSEAYTFFPDSCEIAAFLVTPSSIFGKNKVVPTADEYYGRNGKTWEDWLKRKPKKEDDWYEWGIIGSFSASIEFAEYVGNLTPGVANAKSFEGLFHTTSVAPKTAAILGFSAYMGQEDPVNHGVWFGGTKGVGLSLGVGKLAWNYKLLDSFPPIDLEKEYGAAGRCFCEGLINALLP